MHCSERDRNLPEAATPEEYDEHLQNIIKVNIGDKETFAKIISRKRDNAGNPVGARDSNPRLDGRIYIGELPDGGLEEFTANMVAENLFAQCDDNDNIYRIFDEIIDCYKEGDSVLVVVRWKDGNTSPVPQNRSPSQQPSMRWLHRSRIGPSLPPGYAQC